MLITIKLTCDVSKTIQNRNANISVYNLKCFNIEIVKRDSNININISNLILTLYQSNNTKRELKQTYDQASKQTIFFCQSSLISSSSSYPYASYPLLYCASSVPTCN